MKALSLKIKKLWPMLKFFQRRSKVTVKVTSSKFMVPSERSCQGSHMPNMKDLSLRVKKLWPMLKFFDAQTDRQTDRVITKGHPPT